MEDILIPDGKAKASPSRFANVQELKDVFEASIVSASTGLHIPGVPEGILKETVNIKTLVSRYKEVKKAEASHTLHVFSLMGDVRNRVLNKAKAKDKTSWEYLLQDLNKEYKGKSKDYDSLKDSLERLVSPMTTKVINVLYSMGPSGASRDDALDLTPEIVKNIRAAIIPIAKAYWDANS